MSATPERLLRMLSLLQARPAWSGAQLATKLGITDRTVRRDVTRLRSLGYAVDADLGRDGCYRLRGGTALPPLLLDDEEAFAVVVSLGVTASTSVEGVEEASLRALSKIDRVLPSRVRHRVRSLRATTVRLQGPEDSRVDPDTLAALAHACGESLRVRMAYADRNGHRTERRIDPYRLVSTGRRWYLVGWDVDRTAWRTLRVDRIRSCEVTGHQVELIDPPDAGALVSAAVSTAPYRYAAEIVLHVDIGEARKRIPPTVGTLEPLGPDRCVLRTGADHLPSMAGYVVSLGWRCEVREPPELRAFVATLAGQLAEDHGVGSVARVARTRPLRVK